MKTKSPLLLTAALAAQLTLSLRASPNYTLHEWGTFTSVSGSDGKLLPGVHLEEEPLPRFVYAHEGMEPGAGQDRRWVRPLAGVTIRMETPVLYFYTDKPFDAHVDVKFNGGSISQWYPQRSGGESAPAMRRVVTKGLQEPDMEQNRLDFARGYSGRITWDVKVEPAGEDAMGRVFRHGETPSWIFPRQTDSALVTNKEGESEKYLFYRGVGNFQPPAVFTSADAGQVAARNTGTAPIPGMLAFELNNESEARWAVTRNLAPGGSSRMEPGVKSFTKDWRKAVYAEAVQMLVEAGLYRKEADAMIQTWWPSYFERAGFRVFWIVPRESTDAILPLAVNPAPEKTVRVMVGRTEILSPVFERVLVENFSNPEKNPWRTDRFAPAFAARVSDLSKSTASRAAVPPSVPAPVPPAPALRNAR
jgi:hypothetical protein